MIAGYFRRDALDSPSLGIGFSFFQFVMNKDWLLFFYPGQNFFSPPLLYSKPCLCLTLQKDEINLEFLATLSFRA